MIQTGKYFNEAYVIPSVKVTLREDNGLTFTFSFLIYWIDLHL